MFFKQMMQIHEDATNLIPAQKNRSVVQIYSYTQGVAVPRCSTKQLFLKISQNSQKNTCSGFSFLMRLQVRALQPPTLLRIFCEIFENTFFIEHFRETGFNSFVQRFGLLQIYHMISLRENADQNNSEYGHFLGSVLGTVFLKNNLGVLRP